jgi:plasmid stabilization system protein ParE
MKYRVLIQPTAKAELRKAHRWYYDESPAAASRWLDKLLETIDTLRAHPERCPLAPENDAFEETIRQLLCGKKRGIYRILFTVKEGVVEVLHIRHAAREHLEPERGGD